MTTDTSPRAAARRARPRPARPGRAAVGDPPVLRHPRDDGRRHQPRGGGARLRHARGSSSRPASRACARAGPTTPPTSGRSSCAARCREHLERRYGVRYDPATEILITVGASEAVDLALRATCDPGDEVILHEPSYVAYVPAIVFAGGVVRHVATRFEDDFALDPAAVEAAITPRTKALFLGYPCNPTGAVLPRRRPGRAGRDRRPPRPARLQRRDLRPARLRDVPPPGDERAARDARADDPDGRLLQGLRDDRLAGRLRGGAGARSSRGSSRSTSTGSCRRRRRPRTRPWSRSSRASPTSSGCVAEYDRRRRLIVDGLNALGPRRRSSRAARSTPSRGSPRPG